MRMLRVIRRMGREDEASAAYEAAIALSENRPESEFLEGRLRAL